MRTSPFLLLALLLAGADIPAQTIYRQDELLAPDRPEAWAMNYFAASSLMTSFGPPPPLAPGGWNLALDLGHIPRLGDQERRVGFSGTKLEDLNKSPVFGRLRLTVGLPGQWVGEIGYTPPVSIDGARPHDLIALAIGRPVVERRDYTLSMRVFGQGGEVRGDITCPGGLAGISDSGQNPFGCQAASNDRVTLNHYGIDLTSAWAAGSWRWHAGVGAARTELEVQVDALTFDVRDRSRLVSRDVLPFIAAGGSRDVGPRWSLAMEMLYVPLAVKREPDVPRQNDPLTSLRLQLRYRAD